jgi:hypothetical protein
MRIYWNKYYGYDEKYPRESNYRVISAILFNRSFHLILIWSKLQFVLSVSENLQTQWDELNGPPKKKTYHFKII